MSMEADLVARLAAATAIDALIGKTGGVASISWGLPVQGAAWPALVLVMISPGRDYTHAGPDGLDGPTVQIDVLAETGSAAVALADAVLAAMEAGGTQGSRKFWPGFLESRATVDEGNLEGGKPLYRITQDFQFYHEGA